MPKKKISKEKSIRRTKRLTELAICAVLLVGGGICVKGMVDRSNTVSTNSYKDKAEVEVTDPTEATTEEFDPNKIIYTSKAVKTKDKFAGNLILVNNDHQYFTNGNEDLVSIYDANVERGLEECFSTVDNTYSIRRDTYGPMADMIKAFYDQYHLNTLVIYGSYRTTAFQQQLYDADLAETGSEESVRVAKPGFSEHETGYAFDFSLYYDDHYADYDGTGDYSWFNGNCWKYGFILRYPENKTDVTKFQYEPWHFRYVGVPHAFYMAKNGICLEEYEQLVEQHPYSGEHLEFTVDGGKHMEVYFVASDDGSEETMVPVPSGYKYEISGNNSTGFIVTVYKDEKAEPEAAETQPASRPETQAETAPAEETQPQE